MPELGMDESVNSIDRMLRAHIARFTIGFSPLTLIRAYLSWLVHLTFAPGKQAELVEKGLRRLLCFAIANYARQAAADRNTPPCIEPLRWRFSW